MQDVEVLDCFCEGTGGGWPVRLAFCGGQDVGWEEGETEAEVGRGEDGEGFDEDVGGGFVSGEVGVELVSVVGCALLVSGSEGVYLECDSWTGEHRSLQIELITFLLHTRLLGMSGNRKRCGVLVIT